MCHVLLICFLDMGVYMRASSQDSNSLEQSAALRDVWRWPVLIKTCSMHIKWCGNGFNVLKLHMRWAVTNKNSWWFAIRCCNTVLFSAVPCLYFFTSILACPWLSEDDCHFFNSYFSSFVLLPQMNFYTFGKFWIVSIVSSSFAKSNIFH